MDMLQFLLGLTDQKIHSEKFGLLNDRVYCSRCNHITHVERNNKAILDWEHVCERCRSSVHTCAVRSTVTLLNYISVTRTTYALRTGPNKGAIMVEASLLLNGESVAHYTANRLLNFKQGTDALKLWAYITCRAQRTSSVYLGNKRPPDWRCTFVSTGKRVL